MNPPYAQPAIQHFADKLVDEVEAGHVTAAIALTNDCTDTQWFHRLARAAQGVSFPVGRIPFYSPRGDVANPAQGQALFYFGDNFGRFETVFGDAGVVLRGPP